MKSKEDIKDEILYKHVGKLAVSGIKWKSLDVRKKLLHDAMEEYAQQFKAASSNVEGEGDEMKRHFKQVLKRYVTDFYFWWHNAKGTNTRQGYEQWEKDNDLTIDILMREAGYAANQPQPHESIEELGNTAGIKYALKGVYSTRYCHELQRHSQSHRDRYSPYVDGFYDGFKAAAAEDGQAERMFSLKEMKDAFIDSRQKENPLDDESDPVYKNYQQYFKEKFGQAERGNDGKVKFPEDFKVFENVFAMSFANTHNEEGEVQSDLILFGDREKLIAALVQQMLRNPAVADLIYNSAYDFHQQEPRE